MTTKRPDSFEEFQHKQRAKQSAPPSHNYPDLPSLSHEEITYVEAAREALVTIKRTFEYWVVIARGLKALKDKAERLGGRFTFDRLREREGLGGRDRTSGKEILNKTRLSRLLAILEHIVEVEAWRKETLTDKQRFDWASPEAVWRHCPVFVNPKSDGEKIKRQTTAEQLKAAKAEIERLKARLEHAGGSLFDLANDTAEVIGKILADNMSEGRFDTAVKAAKARYKAKQQRPAG